MEEVEAHCVVLPEETDLAGARAVWAAGGFRALTVGAVSPVTPAGTHRWTRVVWRNAGS